jgi:3-oxoacyl-[acyl-carrier protein] reductase
MKLIGKTAVVVGGGRDIGRSVSVALAKEGANVVVNYQNDDKAASETVAQIDSAGGKAIICQADATSYKDMEKLMATACDTFGGSIDVLANVVGGLVARKPLAEMDEEFFDHVMRLNVNSVFYATKAAAEKMPDGASIVNFASQAGRDGGGPGAAAYATSKGAVMTFTRSMAKELGARNIRVNAVCPGMINTSFHDRFTKDEVREKVAGSTPLGREGAPDEVADLTVYLASSEASFVTGACIDINGGLLFS